MVKQCGACLITISEKNIVMLALTWYALLAFLSCFICFYDHAVHCCMFVDFKDPKETNGMSIMSASDYADAVHNFLLSQKLTTLLGNFPEV